MGINRKYKVEESFGNFIKGTEAIQTSNKIDPAQFGANPDDSQYILPFEFERAPEIGEMANSVISDLLEKIQAISEAGINKANALNKRGNVKEPYIENELNKAYMSLREAYLRLMEIK